MEKEKIKDRFSKWQLLTIEELGKIVNLLMGIGVALIGYQVNLLVDEKYNYEEYKFQFLISLLLILLSVLLGLITSFNRLTDFRTTAILLKKRMDEQPKEEIEKFKSSIASTGKRTWRLFSWQIITFTIGLLILVSFFFFRYKLISSLFCK